MGHVFAEIELSNSRASELDPVRVKALADTGALLCIPEHGALQLKLQSGLSEVRPQKYVSPKIRHGYVSERR